MSCIGKEKQVDASAASQRKEGFNGLTIDSDAQSADNCFINPTVRGTACRTLDDVPHKVGKVQRDVQQSHATEEKHSGTKSSPPQGRKRPRRMAG